MSASATHKVTFHMEEEEEEEETDQTKFNDWVHFNVLHLWTMIQKREKGIAVIKDNELRTTIGTQIKKIKIAIDTLLNDSKKAKEYFEADMTALDIICPEKRRISRGGMGIGGMMAFGAGMSSVW